MRTCLPALALLISLSHSVSAQEHLVPDADAFVDPDSYLLKTRHIFSQAFDEGVILRCLVLPSFHNEYAVGLHVKRERAEAFVLEPSSWIWNTELVRLRQNGEIKDVTGLGKEMKVIPPEKSEALKKLKEKTPADYRSIKATRRARVLPRDLADEIGAVWKEMLLDVRHPKEPILGNDGVIYHFSARLEWRGEISGHTWSPDPDSRTGRLTSLADALGDYARGKTDLSVLRKKLDQTRASTKP